MHLRIYIYMPFYLYDFGILQVSLTKQVYIYISCVVQVRIYGCPGVSPRLSECTFIFQVVQVWRRRKEVMLKEGLDDYCHRHVYPGSCRVGGHGGRGVRLPRYSALDRGCFVWSRR